jgi:hypothetical protein
MRDSQRWSATSRSKRSSAIRPQVGEKGQIEKNVQDARHRLWQPTLNFPTLAALHDWLETRCQELWAQTQHGSQLGSVADALSSPLWKSVKLCWAIGLP